MICLLLFWFYMYVRYNCGNNVIGNNIAPRYPNISELLIVSYIFKFLNIYYIYIMDITVVIPCIYYHFKYIQIHDHIMIVC